jgi:hypothetical protein
MAVVTRLDIDLVFSLVEPGAPESLEGTIRASGTEVTITANHPELLGSRRSVSLARLRDISQEIAALGFSVTLCGPAGLIASIGDVKSSVVHRALTGSPHVRLGSAAAVAPLLRQKSTSAAMPFPPMTLFPLVPTVVRNSRDHISTTHYTPGSGRPRLVFVIGSENWDGTPAREFDLLPETTLIGSGADADLTLPGLGKTTALIRHDSRDEYVLEVAGMAPVTLRTGARIELGDWRMAFFRAEFADHGRPWGGRLGGELSHQRPQQERHRSR